MTHVRTKRKTNQKNIGRLISSLVLVFVFMAVLITISNLAKGKKIKINLPKSNIAVADTDTSVDSSNTDMESPWVLSSTDIMFSPEGDYILVQKVTTEEEHNMGLSGKDRLKMYDQDGKIVTEGMLFVFDTEGKQNFWMKDMKFDLDMIFMDKNFKIVSIAKDAKADSYNREDPNASEIFTNGNALAQYVLEINSGFADKMNLKVGDTLRIQ